jgi:hypothetical protein
MKIDWQLVISFAIALLIFSVLDKLVLGKVLGKIGGSLEETLEETLEID